MKFTDLGLDPSLISALEELKFEECTPIQETTIPIILEGRDVAGLAQTGTGKTAAYLLPIMERILRSKKHKTEDPKRPVFPNWHAKSFSLILVPTRELAEQVYDNVDELGKHADMRAVAIYGGTSYDQQKEKLKQGVEFVIATPGRLIDLYKSHAVDLKQVVSVIFDEADRMFDMGFKDDMKYLLRRIPNDRQFLVYSATLNFDVLNVAYQFGADPVEFNVSRDQAKADNVKDQIFHVGENDKPAHLLSLVKKHQPQQAIIFSNFKNKVERIAKFLSDNGVPAVGISSLLTQSQRQRVMNQFKEQNDQNILVATDVAARGLDIQGVDLVINYELPQDSENYVHRIGRTGRASEVGTAFSMVGEDDIDSLQRIEEYLKHPLEAIWLDDQDLVKDFKAFPPNARPQRAAGHIRNDNRSRPNSKKKGPRRKTSSRSSDRQNNRNERVARTDGSDRNDRGSKKKSSRGGQHRDRVSGRHKDRRKKSSDQSRRSASNGKSQRPQRTHNKRPRTQTSTPSKGIGQKISSFFKKIFTGDSKDK